MQAGERDDPTDLGSHHTPLTAMSYLSCRCRRERCRTPQAASQPDSQHFTAHPTFPRQPLLFPTRLFFCRNLMPTLTSSYMDFLCGLRLICSLVRQWAPLTASFLRPRPHHHCYHRHVSRWKLVVLLSGEERERRGGES